MSSGKKFVVIGHPAKSTNGVECRLVTEGVGWVAGRVTDPSLSDYNRGACLYFSKTQITFLPDEAGAKVGRKFVITGYSPGWNGVECRCWNITGDDVHGDVLEGRGDICSAGSRVIFKRKNTKFFADEPKFEAGDEVLVSSMGGANDWADVVEKAYPEIVLLRDSRRWVNPDILTAQLKFANATTPPDEPKFKIGDRVVAVLDGGVDVVGTVERVLRGGIFIRADSNFPGVLSAAVDDDCATKLPTFPETLVIGEDRPTETRMALDFTADPGIINVSLIGPGGCGTLIAGIRLWTDEVLTVRLNIDPALATNKCREDCDNPSCGIEVANSSMEVLFVWVRRLARELLKVGPKGDWAATVRRIYDEDARRIAVIDLRSRQLPL